MIRDVRRATLVASCLLLFPLASSAADPSQHAWLRIAGNAAARRGDLVADLSPARVSELQAGGYGFVEALMRDEFHLGAEGAVTHRVTLVRRFLSMQGADVAGNVALPVDVARERIEIERAYLEDRGASIPVDLAALQVVNAQGAMFTAMRTLVIPFSGIREGAAAVVVATSTASTKDWPLPWSMRLATRWTVPIERAEVSVTWDEGQPSPDLRTDDPGLRCEKRHKSWFCAGGPLPAFDGDIALEDLSSAIPSLVAAIPQRWPDVAASFRSIVENRMARGESDAADQARRLVRGRNGARDKLESLYRFVADEIRYVAIAEGEGTIAPSPPDVTLRRRFGDCKDKVTLLLAMARAVGLDGYPVLVAVGRFQSDKVLLPMGSYFDHMIACFSGVDATPLCVDPVPSFSPTGLLAAPLQGAVALDLLPEAELRFLPVASAVIDYQVDADLEVKCDGSLVEKLRRKARGSTALDWRARYGGLSTLERSRIATQIYHEYVNRNVTPEFRHLGFDQPGDEVVVESDAVLPGARSLLDSSRFVDHDPWLVALLRSLASNGRRHRFQAMPGRYRSRSVYRVCDATVPMADGPELAFDATFGSLKRQYKVEGQVVTVDTTLQWLGESMDPERARQLDRFLGALGEQSTIQFGLQRRVP